MGKWHLEQRFCLCGCGLSFRCLPSSTAKYSSIFHEPWFTHGEFAHGEINYKKLVKAGFYRAMEEMNEKIRKLEQDLA